MDDLSRILGQNKRFSRLLSDKSLDQHFRREWTSLLGELSKELRFMYFRKGVVWMAAENYMWVNEVGFYQDQILGTLNAFLGKVASSKKVKGIRVRHERPEDVQEKKKVASSRPRRDFLTVIRENVDRRQAAGETLCRRCHLVYTPAVICSFCKVGHTQPTNFRA